MASAHGRQRHGAAFQAAADLIGPGRAPPDRSERAEPRSGRGCSGTGTQESSPADGAAYCAPTHRRSAARWVLTLPAGLLLQRGLRRALRARAEPGRKASNRSRRSQQRAVGLRGSCAAPPAPHGSQQRLTQLQSPSERPADSSAHGGGRETPRGAAAIPGWSPDGGGGTTVTAGRTTAEQCPKHSTSHPPHSHGQPLNVLQRANDNRELCASCCAAPCTAEVCLARRGWAGRRPRAGMGLGHTAAAW